MKSNLKTSIIIVIAIFILTVFTSVISINLLPNNESESYYGKGDNKTNARIENLNIENNILTIKTINSIEFCVKTTRTTPTKDALCWNKIENNQATISVLNNKKYYIWVKDENENISNYLTINSD